MRLTRRDVLASTAVTAGVGLAGCGGNGDGTESPTDDETDTVGETDADDGTATGGTNTATDTPGATVKVSSHPEHGEILVDAQGMTLYMFDNDTQGSGSSACSGGCLAAWPPLTVAGGATAGADVTAELTTFERSDGDTQVAANGWPLYYYASDSAPGDAMGQGANGGIWWVLGPDGTPKRAESTPSPTASM